jgi:hypothetical protein
MEGSMKMMSWSRYHCLSASLLRAERRCRAAKSRKMRLHKIWLHKTLRRSHAPHRRPSAFGADGAQTSYFQFVIRVLRT